MSVRELSKGFKTLCTGSCSWNPWQLPEVLCAERHYGIQNMQISKRCYSLACVCVLTIYLEGFEGVRFITWLML